MDDPVCRAIGRPGKRLGDGDLKNDRINRHGIGDGKGGNEHEADPGHKSQPPAILPRGVVPQPWTRSEFAKPYSSLASR